MSTARPSCDCGPDAISPSQIDTFKHCQRRWGFRKIAQLQEPEFSFQAAGKAIHDMLETYAKQGVLPDRNAKHAKAVWCAVSHLPRPNPAHVCEQHVRVDIGDGVVIHGYPDMLPANTASVYDYKTVSVRAKAFEFAHDEHSLRQDAQALIYGEHVARQHTCDVPIEFHWIYVERAPPHRVKHVSMQMTSSQVFVAFDQHIAPTARLMAEHRRVSADLDGQAKIRYVNEQLAANTDFCGAYQGCPHAAKCQAYVAPTYTPPTKDLTVSEVDSIKQKIAQFTALNRTARAQRTEQPEPQVTPAPKIEVQPEPHQHQPEVSESPAVAPQPDPINPPIENVDERTVPEDTDPIVPAPSPQEVQQQYRITASPVESDNEISLTLTVCGPTLSAALKALKASLEDL